MMNFFDMFAGDESIDAFKKEQEELAKAKEVKAKEVKEKKNVIKEAKKGVVEGSTKKVQPKSKSMEESIEEKIKKCELVRVKAFCFELFTLEKEELKDVKLEDIKNRIVTENGYLEFEGNCAWHLSEHEDGLGILIITYKHNAKG